MALPLFQVVGTLASGTGSISPAWPAHQIDDIALLFVETANEAVTLSTPAGFAEITNQGTGTAGTGTRITVFWARATSASMSAPTIADSGDHQIAQIVTFRGCIKSGNPWDVTVGNVQSSSTTAVSIPGTSTTVAECLVVLAVSNGTDNSSGQLSGNLTNLDLANLTVRANSNATSGNGGGFSVVTGEKTSVGAYAASTGTLSTASIQGKVSIALKPPPTRSGRLGWLEFETPNGQLKGKNSWIEFETPNISIHGKTSWIEFETPNVSVKGKQSWVELQVPNVQFRGKNSFIELEISNSNPRASKLGWTEFEVPNIQVRGKNAWVEAEFPNVQAQGDISWIELEVPGFFFDIQDPITRITMVSFTNISLENSIVADIIEVVRDHQARIPFETFSLTKNPFDGLYTFSIQYRDGRDVTSFIFFNAGSISQSVVGTLVTGNFTLAEFKLLISNTEFLINLIATIGLQRMTWEQKS